MASRLSRFATFTRPFKSKIRQAHPTNKICNSKRSKNINQKVTTCREPWALKGQPRCVSRGRINRKGPVPLTTLFFLSSHVLAVSIPKQNNSFFNNERRNESHINMELGFIEDQFDILLPIYSVLYTNQSITQLYLCSELELGGCVTRDLYHPSLGQGFIAIDLGQHLSGSYFFLHISHPYVNKIL